MTQNPYSTPVAATSAIPDSDSRQSGNASQGKRFLGYIVDRIILWALSYAGGLVLGELFVAGRSRITPDEALFLYWLGFGLGLIIVFLFYVVLEGAFGITIGKLVTGTKVVDETGGKPSFMQILGRTAARFVPFEPFSFFFGCDTRFPTGWHDRWSGTRVVMAK